MRFFFSANFWNRFYQGCRKVLEGQSIGEGEKERHTHAQVYMETAAKGSHPLFPVSTLLVSLPVTALNFFLVSAGHKYLIKTY